MAPTALPTTIAHPPLALFVYFPSHHSLDLLFSSLSFCLCSYSRVYLFLLCLFSPLLTFSSSLIVFQLPLIFSHFPVFHLSNFLLIYLIAQYLLLLSFSFPPFIVISSFPVFPVFFMFIFLSLPSLSISFTLNFFVFFTSFFLFVLYFTRSISSHSSGLFFARLYFISFLSHPSWRSCFFFLLLSFPLRTTSSATEEVVVLVCIPRVPLRTRWFRNCSLIVSHGRHSGPLVNFATRAHSLARGTTILLVSSQ